MMLYAPPPTPQVSYARDVAPILAMRCNSCHGESGGLSTRTYRALMAGGNLGKVIVAGNAEGSLLVHFLEGRRGESRRMPIGGKALSRIEIETIRRWIDEGAAEDSVALPKYERSLHRIRLPPGRTLHVTCRVNTDAYLTIRVRDPKTRRVLLERIGSVKQQLEDGDAGRPGEPVSWDIRPEAGWPKAVDVELVVEYTAGDPGVDLTATL